MQGDNLMLKNKRLFILSFIIIVVFSLFLIKSCDNQKVSTIIKEIPFINNKTEEKSLLKQMKEDEQTLINLYNSSDICSTLWTKEFKDMGIKFQNYEYKGSDNEIILLLEEYKNYGKLIEEIRVLINIKNYDEGIEQLEKLKEVAQKNEKELNRLYEKNYN